SLVLDRIDPSPILLQKDELHNFGTKREPSHENTGRIPSRHERRIMPGADNRTPEKYTIFGCARLHHGRAL
ncbi:hypothetical protein ACC736_38325, partial [Rhizobium ruizarguesonis]